MKENVLEDCFGAGEPIPDLLNRGTFAANWVTGYLVLLGRKTFELLIASWILLILTPSDMVGGTTLTTLFSFEDIKNGYDPRPNLVFFTNGFLYGTTSAGGSNDTGTVFKLAPDGTLTELVVFNSTNGEPYGGLILGRDGVFYGTTFGTVYRVTPEGDYKVLVTFTGTNGQEAFGPLIQANDGNFYGTTEFGGAHDAGTVFKMLPDGTLTTIVSFNITNGFAPMGGLVQATDGNFYGTTSHGGDLDGGIVFRLTAAGELTTLVSFNYTNGYNPSAGLIQAADGNLYGTTAGMFSQPLGTIFRLTTNGVLTTLVSFNGTNGATPLATLMQANDGNLYGTTTFGGPSGRYGVGTIFSISPDGTFNTVYAFTGTNDGIHPRSTLVQSADGNFYGVTSEGGAFNSGNVFRLSLPLRPRLQQPTRSVSIINLSWTAVAGQTYQVEYCTDLAAPIWRPFGDPIIAISGTLSASDARILDARRFYRVELLP